MFLINIVVSARHIRRQVQRRTNTKQQRIFTSRKRFFAAIEEFKTKFNNEEIANAIDKLTESFTKYESVVRREAFIVGVGFGLRIK